MNCSKCGGPMIYSGTAIGPDHKNRRERFRDFVMRREPKQLSFSAYLCLGCGERVFIEEDK